MKKLALSLVVLAVTGILWAMNYHGVNHFLGIDTQASDNYDFFSGSGPVFVTLIGYTGIIITFIRHVNCHVDGCPRLGRYPLAGGKFKVCTRHSPHPDNLSHEHILAMHRKHEQCDAQPRS